MLDTYDIAIIGGGPAGSACALALKGSGLKVVLIDKNIFPRDKVCGDAIPGSSFKAMDTINPKWGEALRQFADKTDIKSSKVCGSNGKNINIDWVLYTCNSKRLNFDDFLLNLVRTETETTILENKSLQKVAIENDFVDCHFRDGSSLKASIVIGCDGANSIVKRQLNKSDSKKNHSCSAVRAYLHGIEEIETGVNETHFFKEVPGYFWIFPLSNGMSNVGLGVLHNDTDKNKINLRETLNKIMTTFPNIAPRFKNAELIGEIKGFALPLGTKKRIISGERYMLCGDAASLIDPLAGHGIDKAMWSGIFAARQAKKCFEASDFKAGFMNQYDSSLYKKVFPELRKSTLIMRILVRYPGLINVLTGFGGYQKTTNKLIRFFRI